MYKVVLWGCGNGYNTFVSHRGYEQVEAVGITDSDISCYKVIDGIPAVSKNEVFEAKIKYDYIIVTVDEDRIYKEIVSEIVSNGISRDIILPSRIFKIPFFNFEDYIIIRNSNVSILSDYCSAGYLYHKFGLKLTSPTINMWADNENYIRFLSDIKGHMELPMEKVDNIIDEPYKGLYSFYRGRLGDCEWNFNHDVIFDTAVERWEKGVDRFNFDNYIAIMTIRTDEMAYKFNALPIKNKIGFYWKQLDLESVICLPQWDSEKVRARHSYNFAGLVNRVADEDGNRAINWMKALQHKNDFSRVG